MSVFWSKITEEHSTVPILDIGTFNYHEFMARCMMTVTSAAPKDFAKAIMQPAWHPAINKDQGRRPTQNDDDMVVLIQGRHDHEGQTSRQW